MSNFGHLLQAFSVAISYRAVQQLTRIQLTQTASCDLSATAEPLTVNSFNRDYKAIAKVN